MSKGTSFEMAIAECRHAREHTWQQPAGACVVVIGVDRRGAVAAIRNCRRIVIEPGVCHSMFIWMMTKMCRRRTLLMVRTIHAHSSPR